jgi:hypothetical protein
VSDVIGLVFLQGLKIVCVGLVFGTVIALVLGRFLTGFVYGISSSDPATVRLLRWCLAWPHCWLVCSRHCAPRGSIRS